jgi:hypothetical protein
MTYKVLEVPTVFRVATSNFDLAILVSSVDEFIIFSHAPVGKLLAQGSTHAREYQ